MHNMSDGDRLEVLGEMMMDEFRVIREYLADIPIMKRDIAVLKEQVLIINERLDVHDWMLRPHEKELAQHTDIVTILKQRCA